ncbi:MAG: hypothetical protein QXL34_07340 [Thermosphaera sp.]
MPTGVSPEEAAIEAIESLLKTEPNDDRLSWLDTHGFDTSGWAYVSLEADLIRELERLRVTPERNLELRKSITNMHLSFEGLEGPKYYVSSYSAITSESILTDPIKLRNLYADLWASSSSQEDSVQNQAEKYPRLEIRMIDGIDDVSLICVNVTPLDQFVMFYDDKRKLFYGIVYQFSDQINEDKYDTKIVSHMFGSGFCTVSVPRSKFDDLQDNGCGYYLNLAAKRIQDIVDEFKTNNTQKP